MFDKVTFKILSTLLISSTFFHSKLWMTYVFRAHPDILLSAMSSLFLVFLYKSKRWSNKSAFYAAAFVGALALSTKQVFILFIPGLIFLEIPPFEKKRFLRLVKFIIVVAVTYFILGFPINFHIDRNLSFLINQSKMSLLPTWGSFIEWWSLLIDQSWLPLVIIVILFICLGKDYKEIPGQKYLYMRLWAVAFMPFIFLLTRKIISSHAHYTLPVVSILLTAVSITLLSLSWNWIAKIKTWFKKDITKYLTAIILLISFHITIGIIPKNVENVLKAVMGGREDVRSTYKIINSYADSGKKVLVEAYVPFRHGHEKIIHGGHLTVTLDNFKNYDPDVVTVNAYQMPHIMEGEKPSDYMIISRENYQEIRQYYGLFYNKRKTVDPWGRKWVKTYQDSMGVQIWQKG
tara:strand:+ start:56 stop:1267 length:1212 start_codon:yes stop_codon:yes gene_type:complete